MYVLAALFQHLGRMFTNMWAVGFPPFTATTTCVPIAPSEQPTYLVTFISTKPRYSFCDLIQLSQILVSIIVNLDCGFISVAADTANHDDQLCDCTNSELSQLKQDSVDKPCSSPAQQLSVGSF